MREIKVKIGDIATLTLGDDWLWKATPASPEEAERADIYEKLANMATRDGPYWPPSPAHGEPGYAIACAMAKRFDGEAILPPVPPGNPEDVY